MKRVLIVDALNAYLRAYIVDPSVVNKRTTYRRSKGFCKDPSKTSASNKTKRCCSLLGWP